MTVFSVHVYLRIPIHQFRYVKIHYHMNNKQLKKKFSEVVYFSHYVRKGPSQIYLFKLI